MKLNLTTWQRIICTQMVGSLTGDIAFMRKTGKALDALELTDADRESAGLANDSIVKPEVGESVRRWPVEIADREAAHWFCEFIAKWNHWPNATRATRDTIEDLVRQLEKDS